MILEGKKVLVIGMAKSGVSAAFFCKKHKAEVTASDSKSETEIQETAQLLSANNIKLCFGKNPDEIIKDFDLVILSPGVPRNIPALAVADKLNIPVISEIELAYQYCKGNIAAITGTNGKTTTTILTGEIIKAYNANTFVVGNVGIPFADEVEKITSEGYAVAELSSFQLETVKEFHPKISAVLNITPDHLNRHKTFENYIKMKERIFENQTSEDFCVLNYDDEYSRSMSNRAKSKTVFFSTKEKLHEGIYLEDGFIFVKFLGLNERLIHIDEMKIFGNHNVQNAMAAIAISICADVPIEIIKKVLREFKGVEHRIEYVATVDGVEYYNDSKGTNPDAAIQAVKAMKKPTVLIGGGYDKGSDFTEWIEAFNGKIKKLILIGVTATKIKQTAEKLGYNDCIITDTFENAMKLARENAKSGECVLLSPACASWGMFDNYEQRGRIFKEIVHGFEVKKAL